MNDHTTTTGLQPPGSVARAQTEPQLRPAAADRGRRRDWRAAKARLVLLLIVLMAAAGATAYW